MKPSIQFWLIFSALALILRQCAAADAPFIIDTWNTDDQLPQNSVVAITQTRDGYFWLGTLNGLVRFDGNSMTRFNVANTPALPENKIVFLFQDSHTNLWVGTDNGSLCQIQNGVVKNFDTGDLGGGIGGAFEDPDGSVWFATRDGKFLCWQNGALVQHPKIDSARSLFLTYLARRWIVPDKTGVVWELQHGHVEQWQGSKQIKDFGPIPWGDTPILSACEDNDGNLIVGTSGAGIFWFDATGKYQRIFAEEDATTRNYIPALFFDHEGNLWVGTDGGGLNRVQRRVFVTPEKLPSAVVWSAAEDGQGGLWASFNFRGLSYLLTNSVRDYRIGSLSLPGPVLVDSQQNVWTGTSREGLFHLESGTFNPVAGATPVGQQIYALFQGHDGRVWAGGNGTLGAYDGQSWQVFTAADGLPTGPVRALAEDGNHALWIGTGGGLYSLQAGKITPTNAPVRDISCLLVDHAGVLWVGTVGHGLAKLQNGSWQVFTEKDGLINDVGYLLEDDAGNLWIGSYEGLMRVTAKSFTDFDGSHGDLDRRLSSRMFLTTECSLGVQPAAIRTREGKLMFPTTVGLVSLNPADLRPNTNPPPVVIESVLIDGVDQRTNSLALGWDSTVTLTPENDRLEVRFTALDFSAPKGARQTVRFRYKLIGYDKNWTDIGDERTLRFPRLPPDNYTLNIQACNEDGVWSETGASLAIIVLPPFWRTPGFIITSVLVVIGILAGTIYLISTAKLKRQLRALHQKELIERERARIARDLHDQLGANLTQVTLLGEMAEVDKHLPDEIEQHAQQICETARETTRALDEIVWAVNPANDTLEGLINYAGKYAQDYFALAKLRYRADLPAQLPHILILPEVRHNVFLAFKEAVNNVVKHANATEARVRVAVEADRFILSVQDNGRGLGDISAKSLRNGMKNMRRRLADVRGEFDIAPGPEGGTMVQLKVPITRPNP